MVLGSRYKRTGQRRKPRSPSALCSTMHEFYAQKANEIVLTLATPGCGQACGSAEMCTYCCRSSDAWIWTERRRGAQSDDAVRTVVCRCCSNIAARSKPPSKHRFGNHLYRRSCLERLTVSPHRGVVANNGLRSLRRYIQGDPPPKKSKPLQNQ